MFSNTGYFANLSLFLICVSLTMRELRSYLHFFTCVWIILFRSFFHEVISSDFRSSFLIKDANHITFLIWVVFFPVYLCLSYFAYDAVSYFYKVLCNQIYLSSLLLLLDFEPYMVKMFSPLQNYKVIYPWTCFLKKLAIQTFFMSSIQCMPHVIPVRCSGCLALTITPHLAISPRCLNSTVVTTTTPLLLCVVSIYFFYSSLKVRLCFASLNLVPCDMFILC